MAIIGNIYKLEKLLQDKNLGFVFDYFRNALNINSTVHKRIMNLPLGAFERVDLENGSFALEQAYYTKKREDCFVESHRKFIDFQLILSGTEQMEYIDVDKLSVKEEYDDKKDLIIYNTPLNTSKFVLQKQDLAIFFPEDAHIGPPMFNKPELVYKTVIKYPIEAYGI